MMFHLLTLLSGISLFSLAAAQQNLWQVTVGDANGARVFVPEYVVSHVPTSQPNRHTDSLSFRVHRLGILSTSHSIP